MTKEDKYSWIDKIISPALRPMMRQACEEAELAYKWFKETRESNE